MADLKKLEPRIG